MHVRRGYLVASMAGARWVCQSLAVGHMSRRELNVEIMSDLQHVLHVMFCTVGEQEGHSDGWYI